VLDGYNHKPTTRWGSEYSQLPGLRLWVRQRTLSDGKFPESQRARNLIKVAAKLMTWYPNHDVGYLSCAQTLNCVKRAVRCIVTHYELILRY
jgi:hypothetical protein